MGFNGGIGFASGGSSGGGGSGTKQFITVTTPSPTVLTNSFFSGVQITEIDAMNQVYLRDNDFTQSGPGGTGDTITAITFGFYEGQLILAKT